MDPRYQENRELVQLQTKQSEQTAFVLAQMAIVREENLRLVEKLADMSQKQAEDMLLLIETCQRNRSDLS